MKINFSKYLKEGRNIVEWAIIHMMTQREKNLGLPEWKMKHAGGPMDTENLDVTLTIEGVEVNFVEALEAIQRHNGVMAAEKAKELLDEKCGALYEKIHELEGMFDRLIKEEKEKLFGPEEERRR